MFSFFPVFSYLNISKAIISYVSMFRWFRYVYCRFSQPKAIIPHSFLCHNFLCDTYIVIESYFSEVTLWWSVNLQVYGLAMEVWICSSKVVLELEHLDLNGGIYS